MTSLAGWTPRPRPERRVHEGRYVRLEPLDPARHAADLYAASTGPGADERFRYLAEIPPADSATFAPWLARCAASDDPLYYAIVDQATGRTEGRLTFLRIDAAHGVIETGHILFGPRLARTPGATEAIYLQARHAFDDLGYRRFEWKCNSRNEPSKRAALRFGFTFEGVFRQHMVVKGENRDTAWFAMLDHEWPARKRAFERWLDPANFEAGRQRLSLSALMAEAIVADGSQLPLRRAASADIPALAELQRAAYAPVRSTLGVEPLPLLFDYGSVLARYEVWLAGEGTEGALILDPQPDHLLIWSLATAPASQAKGLGTSLLSAAEARARQLGLTILRLYTGEKNTRQVRWYHRHGYAIERVEELDDRRIVHMTKIIA